jgi:hypothetical protein
MICVFPFSNGIPDPGLALNTVLPQMFIVGIPYRVLVGHSLGGPMAINTLINHTDLFSAYLAIDPGM